MIQLNRYVPILRTKAGEFTALANLSDETRAQLSPMFEFRPMGASEKKNNMSLDAYLGRACNNILKKWTSGAYIFDIYGIPHQQKLKNGKSPLGFILETLSTGDVSFIPTVGLDRETDYKTELATFLRQRNGSGEICLRLDRNDLQLPQKTATDIKSLLNDLGIENGHAHLLIDFRSIPEETVDGHFDSISNLTGEIEIDSWSTFTVAGSSIPEDVSGMSTDRPNTIRRKEFELWRSLAESTPVIGRTPNFGDYTIINPDKADAFVPPNKISTKIRYTTAQSWLVWRGTRHETSATKRTEYQELSEKIVSHSEFKGKDFSWGDLNIFDCSQRTKDYCQAGKWVQIDVNHHLAFVSEQIANSDVFS